METLLGSGVGLHAANERGMMPRLVPMAAHLLAHSSKSKYRVRRFRVVYAVHQKTRIIRLMAVGHRRSVYEELTERLRRKTQE